jgi:hypothetical protein
MYDDDNDAALHQKSLEEAQQFIATKLQPSHCFFIADRIKKSMNRVDNDILMGCGPVKCDLNQDGQLISTKKFIEVMDFNWKSYRITVEEI